MTGKNLLRGYKITEIVTIIIIILANLLTKWYHSVGVKSISYASGDAFDIILKSLLIENFKESNFISYFFRVYHDLTLISYLNITFFFGPILSSILILVIILIFKKYDYFIAGIISSLFIILNPWISMYSTDLSKEIFIV